MKGSEHPTGLRQTGKKRPIYALSCWRRDQFVPIDEYQAQVMMVTAVSETAFSLVLGSIF